MTIAANQSTGSFFLLLFSNNSPPFPSTALSPSMVESSSLACGQTNEMRSHATPSSKTTNGTWARLPCSERLENHLDSKMYAAGTTTQSIPRRGTTCKDRKLLLTRKAALDASTATTSLRCFGCHVNCHPSNALSSCSGVAGRART